MGVKITAVLWGLAEATLFFVVPDVLLSFVAVRRLRPALIASLLAACGALAGGAAMYAWGAQDEPGAVTALQRLPAVGPTTIDRVDAELARSGLITLFVGPFTGKPYKIYAVKAAAKGVSLPLFLLISFPARALRFLLVSLVVNGLSMTVFGSWTLERRWMLVGVFWALFYFVFWTLMPS